jgi:hypothetical protein
VRGAARSPPGSQGDSPTPGRQPAAPYGREPTGRGAAAGRMPPLPQAGSPLRNAAAVTAPARTGRVVLLAAGHSLAAQRSPSRALTTLASFGWRYAPLLTVIFRGKTRHLSGGRGKNRALSTQLANAGREAEGQE